MSTKAIRRALELSLGGKVAEEALAEVEAIEKAAKGLHRMNIGDFTYNIRDHVAGDSNFTGNSWEHPDVTAWSDASEVMRKISEDSP